MANEKKAAANACIVCLKKSLQSLARSCHHATNPHARTHTALIISLPLRTLPLQDMDKIWPKKAKKPWPKNKKLPKKCDDFLAPHRYVSHKYDTQCAWPDQEPR